MRTMVVSTQLGEAYADPSGGLLWVLLEQLGTAEHTMCVVMWPEDDQSRYLVVHTTAEAGRYGLQFEDGDRASRWTSPGTLDFDQAHDVLVRFGFGRTPWRELCDWAEDEPIVEED